MKFNLAIAVGFALSSLVACQKEDGNKSREPTPPAVVALPAGPTIELGLTGGLTVAGIDWVLPKYLEGKLDRYGYSSSEAAFNLNLTHEDEQKTARLNSGFTTKVCKPALEAESFVALSVAPDNLPESLKTDTDEISSWLAESKNFTGRIFLKKRYKSQGDTGIYRIDLLLADELRSQCVLWNFSLTPEKGVSADSIESSAEYRELIGSLSKTWQGLGLNFDD